MRNERQFESAREREARISAQSFRPLGCLSKRLKQHPSLQSALNGFPHINANQSATVQLADYYIYKKNYMLLTTVVRPPRWPTKCLQSVLLNFKILKLWSLQIHNATMKNAKLLPPQTKNPPLPITKNLPPITTSERCCVSEN
jgi:hypothetical protein